jgi:hydroxymethylglutaryl-CoA lyase
LSRQLKRSTFTSTTINSTAARSSTSTASPLDVQIVEVGPRDGLQNERRMVNTNDKVQFIQLLMNAGCTNIEVGSFVSPTAVPNMANTHEVVEQLSELRRQCVDEAVAMAPTKSKRTTDQVRFSVLVPTIKCLQDALVHRHTLDEIAIFASASETFSQRNLQCSIAESMQRYTEIIQVVKSNNNKQNEKQIPIRGYLSCAIGCPYEGRISSQKVGQLTEQMLQLGCNEIALSDTIGIGTPQSTKEMIEDALLASGGQSNLLAVHFHDT